MDASSTESLLRKKLQTFLGEVLRMGTVKGFKYFAMYLRGREEMVISVVNEPPTHSSSYIDDARLQTHQPHQELSHSGSLTSNNLPYDQRSLMLSARSQLHLSTHGAQGVGLPPASPSDEENMPGDEHSTIFLIAGYARYSCPYVWVRSNHDRLVRLNGDSTGEKDSPLRLKSTLKWKDSDVHIWDIIGEIVKLCTYPAPINPFEVDFDYFRSLSPAEKVHSTAAIVDCLQKILLYTPDNKHYAGKVFEELQLITKQHFVALQQLIWQQGLPVLQKHQTSSSSQQRVLCQGSKRPSPAQTTTVSARGHVQHRDQYWSYGSRPSTQQQARYAAPPTSQQHTGYSYSGPPTLF